MSKGGNGSRRSPNTIRKECTCSCECKDGINFSATATIPDKPKCSRCIMGIHLNMRN